MPDPPVDPRPILLRPATFNRHHGAMEYVEGLIRTRAPRPSGGRWAGLKPGAWGLLASGATISAGGGLGLGTGTVNLCTLDGTTLTDTGESVTVYNSGPAITATGAAKAVPLEWTEAGWSACECAATTSCDDGKICVTLTNCCPPLAGGPLSGATIGVTRHSDGHSMGTCTTDATGKCCIPVPGGDDYDVTISKPGCSTLGFAGDTPIPVHVDCGATVNIGRCLYCGTPPINACYVFDVRGCNALALSGATVSVTGPKSGGGATDSSGKYTFCTDKLGTYSYTVSKSRFATQTGTFTISGTLCAAGSGGGTVGLAPAAGYVCCDDGSCADPAPTTIIATGPIGTVSLHYCASIGGTPGWNGIGTFTSSALDNTPNAACPTGMKTGPVSFLVALRCFGGGLLQAKVDVFGANSFTSFDPGTYSVSGCTYSYFQHCIAIPDLGSAQASTVTSCAPFMATVNMTHGSGVGAIVNGPWVFSE